MRNTRQEHQLTLHDQRGMGVKFAQIGHLDLKTTGEKKEKGLRPMSSACWVERADGANNRAPVTEDGATMRVSTAAMSATR